MPFFKSRGWDVSNEAGPPHHQREVVVERFESETTGRPDYNPTLPAKQLNEVAQCVEMFPCARGEAPPRPYRVPKTGEGYCGQGLASRKNLCQA